MAGERLTRCVVATQRPPVNASSARPMFITRVSGIGGALIQAPFLFCTSSPICSVPCSKRVRNAESRCGPTPWTSDVSESVVGGHGYFTSFSLFC